MGLTTVAIPTIDPAGLPEAELSNCTKLQDSIHELDRLVQALESAIALFDYSRKLMREVD